MLKQLTDLNFNLILSLLAARYLCAWILKSVLNLPAEEHSGLSQASQMELFGRIVEILFKLTVLFFKKIPGMFAGPANTSDIF